MSKKIIITGGAWFIGSNFLNLIVKKYTDIDFINIDSLTYAWKLSNIDNEVKESSNYFFEQTDIRDLEQLDELYSKYRPTDIIHFAAESHVDNSIKNPSIFVETNVIGTQNLLNLHRKFWLNRFHLISTDEVYWDIPDTGYFTESTPLNPSSPYSASKASADMLTKAYWRTFGLDYVITRCSNNYWPNQDKEKLIPHFIDLLKNWKKVTVYGDGTNVRDWLFVQDHCEAVWHVFTNAKRWAIYNIWGNNEYTNLEITRILLKAVWKDDSYISFVPDRLGHDRRYAIDASKIANELWWKPKVGFEEWIKETISFYINNL